MAEAESLKVKTAGGTLGIEKLIDEDYPGFLISIDNHGVVAVEYDQSRGKFRAHVWHLSPKPEEFDCDHEPDASIDITVCPQCLQADAEESGPKLPQTHRTDGMSESDICAALRAGAVDYVALDDIVQRIARGFAAEIGQRGLEAQVAYIVRSGRTAELDDLLAKTAQPSEAAEEGA